MAGVCTRLVGHRQMHNQRRRRQPPVVLTMWTEPLMSKVRLKPLNKADCGELVWNERLNDMLQCQHPGAAQLLSAEISKPAKSGICLDRYLALSLMD